MNDAFEMLRDYVKMDANCPCCDCTDTCDPECTFKDDCPSDYPKMARAREVLAEVSRLIEEAGK